MTGTLLVDRMQRRFLAEQPDAALLGAFVARRDGDAFRALVERYGPLVWSVCRWELSDGPAAEDATQATFLALVRQAPRVRPNALAAWLACVARRISRKARHAETRRRRRETVAAVAASAGTPAAELSVRELLALLDAELANLPPRYQSALLACYWQGQPQTAAARQLGITPAALKGLLERGRARLVNGLRRRGLTADVALRGLLVAPLALVALPGDLTARTAALPAGRVSPAVAKLLPATGWLRWGTGVAAALALGLGFVFAPSALPQGPAREAPAEKKPSPPPEPRADALGDPLPDGALLRLGTLRFKHPNNAHELALSPDGKIVVTEGSSQLIAWDAATGKQLWSSPLPANVIGGSCAGENRLAFTPDGKRLVSPGPVNSVIMWDLATGANQLVNLKVADGGRVSAVDVSPDGKSLAVGTSGGVILSDFEGNVRKEIARERGGPKDQNDRLQFHGDYAFVKFSPDGKTLAVTGNRAKVLRFFDPNTGEERKRVDLTAYLVRLAFSPDSQRVGVTERDASVRVYEVESGQRLHSWTLKLNNPYENYTSAVAFSLDGKLVAAGATDHVIYLWDAVTGKEAGQLKGTGWYPWGLAFSSDGKTLFSTGWDGAIRRWDVAARKQLPLPEGGVRGSDAVAASPDGKLLAYADDAGVLRLVDAKTGRELKQLQTEKGNPERLGFSRDGQLLGAGGSHDDQVHVILWDVAAGTVKRRWDWDKGRDPHSTVEDIAFSPDGKQIAVAVFRRSEARILDVVGEQQRQLKHNMIYGLDFAPDGKTLATAGWDKAVRYWDPATGELQRQAVLEIPNHDTRLYGVRYSPDGRLLAGAAMDGEVFVWDAKQLVQRNRIAVGTRFIFNGLAFSPDGLRIATGDMGGHVRVWDSLTGAKLWERGQHGGHMYVLSFGRDSRTLLAGGNGLGYLWDLRPADLPQKSLPELWKDLNGSDAVAADRAFWALTDRPDDAVKLLSENVRLQPTQPVDAGKAGRLIAELDDTRFAKREAAEGELAKLGRGAIPLLKKALATSESAEQRRRLAKLLDRFADDEATMQRYRRLVGVLRQLDTPAAAALLRNWATTAPDSLADVAAGR